MEKQINEHYKMYKSGKKWVYASVFATVILTSVATASVSADSTDNTSGLNNTSATLRETGDGISHVTASNFLDYFSLNGSATYDASQGVVTLTTDNNNLVGNFSLKSKIDMNSSFTLTGQVNLGNKVSSKGGADGIGFAFHDGNTTDIGNAGGNLGIGGLINAVGFKLDTYHNDDRTPQSALPGAQVSPNNSNGYGWSADPSGSQYPQFGGFVTTSDQEIQATDGNSYQRWWAKTDTSSVQKLKDNDLDNNFHDFVASYDGATRVLTISYTETDGNTLTWTKTIDSSSQAMALIVSASTGGSKNLQQFKINSFDFKQAATVNVKYVDTKGNQVAQGTVAYSNGGANVNSTYSTEQLDVAGYKFLKMGDNDTTGVSIVPSGTLTKPGDNGTVVYVYAPDYTQTTKTINETINYVDNKGNVIADKATATPITFLTVTNPVDNTKTIYYSTTATTATLDPITGVPTGSDWTQGDSANFSSVDNPNIANYTVISNDAPNSDLTQVSQQTVSSDSSDLNFTVVYAPEYKQSTKTVNETINYVDEQNQVVATQATATPITFLTVTNPIDDSKTVYYSTTATTATLDPNTGVPTGSDWIEGDSGTFASVDNPTVDGYHVISNNAPDSNLVKVSEQVVNNGSNDLIYTVVYSKDTPSSDTPSSDVPSSDTPSSDVPSSDVPSSDTPSSDVPSSDTPSSDVPSSDVPSSDTPSSDVPSSDVPSSDTPSSDVPSSDTPSSDTPSSDTPSSDVPSSDVPSSDTPSSDVPSSDVPSSDTPSSDVPSSDVPSSDTPSSDTPSSDVPSSDTPSSDVPSSDTPSSDTPSSDVPSSDTPSSDVPSSDTPSSDVPSSDVPSSDTPSSDVPSSDVPSSDTPSSDVPSSDTPSSDTPSSDTPSSDVPSSDVPSSDTPSSDVPSSDVPSSDTPSSDVPSSDVPSSDTPSSDVPSSDTPSSDVPSSDTPSSDVPSSDTPSSDTPSSDVPSSDTPSSDVPSSDVPSSDVPSSDTPSSDVPSSDTPSSDVPSSDTPSSDVPSSDTPSSDVPSSDTPSSDVPSGAVPSSPTVNVVYKVTNKNGKKLPDTGENKDNHAGAIAAALLAGGLGVTSVIRKKKSDD
ncbi:lectin-like domain-containing protein [Leuconostoc pseudomesenteroides]|uniref:lectin-like domain-containing protein n=1 Tax=Leuconostoc pseudomesenteroides TaxID=33968 RepID=UPI0021A3F324|nr:KxYKxGKxW signal peptide domain-containing protein [Leuconostoc pseudomesenteroides]MCT4380108.1 LPXTG cell wall anchor domain-containing protein [Leuconostoc pseudomesenteroides]